MDEIKALDEIPIIESMPSLAQMEDQVIGEVIGEVFQDFDSDDDDELNKDEFERFVYIALVSEGVRHYGTFYGLKTDKLFQKCYDAIDEDGNGGVDRDELAHFIRMYS